MRERPECASFIADVATAGPPASGCVLCHGRWPLPSLPELRDDGAAGLVSGQLRHPSTLAIMHGGSYRGDGGAALRVLADAYESEFPVTRMATGSAATAPLTRSEERRVGKECR